jgi:aspartyl-tRNA(Asn)/glutamyl-tRNA(Gln) amidotransferase subunit B
MDYRYFPEPDLPALVLTQDYIAARVIAEVPMDRRERYLQTYQLSADDARILSADRQVSDYYEALVSMTNDPRRSCSYLTTLIFGLFEEHQLPVDLKSLKFAPQELAKVITLVGADSLSSTASKEVVKELFEQGGSAEAIIASRGLGQLNDTAALEAIVAEVLSASATQIADYQSGKIGLFGYFVGQCMKLSGGKGNPKIFTDILKGKIG